MLYFINELYNGKRTYPPVYEEQAEIYEKYVYEYEQNREAYESMTIDDWVELDYNKSK